MKHLLIPALALGLLSCGAEGTSTPAQDTDASPYSAEDEALYMERFEQISNPTARSGLGLGGYDPLEDVPGAPEYSPLPTGETGDVSAEALETAEAYAAANNSQAYLVWKDGKVIDQGYYDGKDASSLIISRSLAKPITAIAIGRAIVLGKIKSLDQPVTDFITEWKGSEKHAPMLIRHLLDQRSGFTPQGQAMEPENVLNRAYLHPRHDEVIINDMPVEYTPGTQYEYANATSEMIAPVIERATGMRYAEFVSQEVLQKLGGKGGKVWVNREGGTAHAGCCILLPAEDWLRMAILVLQDGVWEGERLLPEGYVTDMRTGTEQNQYYGKGLWLPGVYTERRGFANPRVPYGKVLHSEPYLDKEMMMFDGNSNQIVYIIPSANMVVLRVGNRPPSAPEWDNTFLPNTLIRGTTYAAGSEPEPQPMSR